MGCDQEYRELADWLKDFMATEPAGKCDWLPLAAKHPDLVREKSLVNGI